MGSSVPNGRILNSWKEIAGYMGRGVRTAQRYEANLGLPVRRPAASDRSSVLAFSNEIDQWLLSSPKRHAHDPESSHACKVFSEILEMLRKHAAECPECGRRLGKTLSGSKASYAQLGN